MNRLTESTIMFDDVTICIPSAVSKGNDTLDRVGIVTMLGTLYRALEFATSCKTTFSIEIVINGPGDHEVIRAQIRQIVNEIRNIRCVSRCRIRSSLAVGKIQAVNETIASIMGLKTAGLVVIDDDLLLPRDILLEVAVFLSAQTNSAEVWSCIKAPLSFSTRDCVSRNICFLFHPSVQRLLKKAGLLTRNRPTGSFYAVRPSGIRPFPDPCNEAEYFSNIECVVSETSIKTMYPKTRSLEVERRIKHVKSENPATGLQTSKTRSYTLQDLSVKLNHLPLFIQERVSDCFVELQNVCHEAIRHAAL